MLFGICPRMSRMSKFRHTYVIMYSNFMVIVESCGVQMQSLEEFNQFIGLWNRLSLERLQATVLQYLIWSPLQISEYAIVF